jgi:hypothetical protein
MIRVELSKAISAVPREDRTGNQLTYKIKKEFACRQVIHPKTTQITWQKAG